MKRSPEVTRARTALLILTTVWGSTFVVIQSGIGVISPLLLISLRFLLAAAVLAAFRPRAFGAGLRIIVPVLPMSLAILAGFALQTWGLASTTPARSAFITSLSVVIVPVFDFFDTKRLPRWRLLGAAVGAAIGVWFLFRPIGGEWHRGDTLTLIGSVIFAFYVVELGRMSVKYGAAELAMAQFVSIGVMAGALSLGFETLRFDHSWLPVAVIGYLGVICTALTFVLMTWAQARVGAVEAAVIYTLEPVIAAIFSVLLGREPLSAKILLGGTFIVGAMLLASTDPSEPHPVAPPEGLD